MTILLVALLVKHLIVDFFLQPPWMWQNKGTYGHIGGVAHAALHGFVTFVILALAACRSIEMSLYLGLFQWFWMVITEFTIHYHMDWFKMWICKRKNWKANNSEAYWYMMGIDQCVHFGNYILIASYISQAWRL